MRTPGIAGEQANGEKMRWMHFSLHILRPNNQLVPSADIPCEGSFAPVHEGAISRALEDCKPSLHLPLVYQFMLPQHNQRWEVM